MARESFPRLVCSGTVCFGHPLHRWISIASQRTKARSYEAIDVEVWEWWKIRGLVSIGFHGQVY